MGEYHFKDLNIEGSAWCDEKDEFVAIRADETSSARVVKDYGVALYLNLSNPEKQSIALLFGLWPLGTYAAARLFVGDAAPRKLTYRYVHSIRKKRNAIAFVQATDIGLSEFSIRTMKCRVLEQD